MIRNTTAATSLDAPGPSPAPIAKMPQSIAGPAGRLMRMLALLRGACRDQAILAAVRRTAMYAGVGVFMTPAFFFWVVIAVEEYIPDMTFREFVDVPYVREFVGVWWFVVVLVVAALAESARREGSKGSDPAGVKFSSR